MSPADAVTRTGLDAVETASALLQRIRRSHPTAALYEAAEVQWWWHKPRSTDTAPQLFWLDDDGIPEAAAILTDWGSGGSMMYSDPTLLLATLPGVSAQIRTALLDAALAHASDLEIETVSMEVAHDDADLQAALTERGFTAVTDVLVQCWMDIDARQAPTSLAEGYRLADRVGQEATPHHLGGATRSETDARVRATSLYRDDLDLTVLDADGAVAAYTLFWFDPTTRTGIVEPVRTSEAHQKRGLSRFLLTTGLERVAALGVQRMAIAYEPENPASGALYRSVGFEPHRRTALWTGSTRRS